MYTAMHEHPNRLKHAGSHEVALVAMGNPLRGDDAIGLHLLAGLPIELSTSLCRLDAGSYTRDLPGFLHGHQVGIIVDAAKGTSDELVMIDISAMTPRQNVLFGCSHALSWFDEIILYRKDFVLPKHLFFVGIPTYDTEWREGLSKPLQDRLPQFVKELCQLIERERADYA